MFPNAVFKAIEHNASFSGKKQNAYFIVIELNVIIPKRFLKAIEHNACFSGKNRMLILVL